MANNPVADKNRALGADLGCRSFGVGSRYSRACFRLGLAGVACLLSVHVATAQDINTVFEALKALYASTNGGSWTLSTNWDTTSVPTATELQTWYGVTYGDDGLTALSMRDNGLDGMLPDALGTLDSLRFLNFADNSLDGSIPATLGNLTKLSELNLSDNSLEGSIPDALGNLTELDTLDLGSNTLSGSIPDTLGNLTELITLWFSDNDLSGPVPDALGNLTLLQNLVLSNNSLSGPVPDALGNLTLLNFLILSNNSLTGHLPLSLTQIPTAGFYDLFYFDFQMNDGLCAPLDAGFQAWFSSIYLGYGSNCSALSLDGTIPDQEYSLDVTIDDLVLPEASGGFTPLRYSLSPNLPAGLDFDPSTRTLSGTPSAEMAATPFTYTVTDEIDSTASQMFTLAVQSGGPLDLDETIPHQSYTHGEAIDDLVLPQATGGVLPLSYSLSPDLPTGLDFDPSTRTISGTPTEVVGQLSLTYTVTDDVDSTASLSFTMSVESTLALGAVAGQLYYVNEEIDELVLPEATGGTPPYEYSFFSLPAGLNFAAATRTLSGTPTADHSPRNYFYSVEDAVGSRRGKNLKIEIRDRKVLLALSVLKALYAATGGDDWDNNDNWDITKSVISSSQLNTWQGVTYGNEGLTRLALSSNNLSGPIPASLGKLTDLQDLFLSENNLSGPIPDSLGNLTELKSLHLVNNDLSGPIPASLGNLTKVESFALEHNDLSGPIPASLGNLESMTLFGLFDNKLSGPIPDALGNLTAVSVFSLHENNLSGPIPGTLGNLTKARIIRLNDNDLSGPIPDGFGNLAAALQLLNLHENDLSGPIPDTLGNLAALAGLNLSGNKLSGPIPETLGNLANLRGLILNDNSLTGHLLTQLNALRSLKWQDNDGLCAPLDAAFQAWLAPLRLAGDAEGPDCVGLLVGETIPDQTYTEGVTISDLVLPEASGGILPLTYALSPAPPAGLAFDLLSRTLSGTPTAVMARTEYTYTVKDHVDSTASQTFNIEVKPALALDAVADQVYFVGAEIGSVALPAAVGGTGPYAYTLTPAPPAGLAFDASTHVLSGTPTAVAAPAEYTYTVTDSVGTAVSHTFNIEVKAGLALAAVADQVYYVGAEIADLVLPSAAGGATPYVYALSPAPPAGLAYDELSRTLSGMPTSVAAPAEYTYTVTDSVGTTVSQTFNIEVKAGLALAALTDQVYYVGAEIGDVELPAAVGGATPYVYALSPAPPAGLAFDASTHTLGGTPTAVAAPAEYTYTVTDSVGTTVSQTFNIEVQAGLALDALANQVYFVGAEIGDVELPAAAGGATPYVYALSPAPPAGLAFDASTHTLSGTPTAVAAPAQYTYTVTDDVGTVVSQAFTIEVQAGLALGAIADQVYVAGADIPDLELPAAVGGATPYAYALSPALPAGLAFDASTHTLSGTPALGMPPAQYTYAVTDNIGSAASQTFTIEVKLALDVIADQLYYVDEEVTGLELPEAAGGTSPYAYVLSPAPPAGLVFDASTRTLSGTPTAVMAPTVYTYTATDDVGATASQTLSIEVQLLLGLASVTDQVYQVGKVIRELALPPAEGGTGPYEYTFSPAPPAGLDYDELSRTLSGTPTAEMARALYTYSVKDAVDSTVSQTFYIEVKPALVLVAVEDRVYLVGETITDLAFPVAVGGTGPYRYALSPAPPAGLAFDSLLRTLSGTPSADLAPTVYTYTAKDAVDSTVSQSFTIEVVRGLGLPPVANQMYVVGEAILDLVLPPVVGGAGPYVYTLSPAPPAGLDYDELLRTLSGTPTAVAAQAEYTYTVTDADNETASQTFTIEVAPALALEAITDQVYVVGAAISEWALPAAEGGTGPYVYALSPAPPAGLVFDAASRTLSGMPTAAMARALYTYTVTDAVGRSASQTFSIEVLLSLGLPPVADQVYYVNEAIPDLALLPVVGGTGPYVYALSPALPAGLAFDASSRTLSGTPTAEMARALYTYTVTDAIDSTASQTFTIEVRRALALGAVEDQVYVVGAAILDLMLPPAEGGTGPYGYALSPAPPPGLVFDASTHTLSGTPMAVAAQAEYTYTVTDSVGTTASQTFAIEVTAGLALRAIPNQVYVVGAAIPDLELPAAVGGATPYGYALSPAPPAGLDFDASSHTLSGTPALGMPQTRYTYTVTDAVDSTASRTFTIEVQLVLEAIPNQEYVIGAAIADLELPPAEGGTGPYGYALSPAPPAGLEFDAPSRTLSGTPMAVVAQAAYTYTATDAAQAAASQRFTIEVKLPFGLSPVANQMYFVGEEIAPLVLPPAVGGATPYAYALSPAPPAGLVFDASSHTLSGTPTAVVARTLYTYTVTDAIDSTASQTFTMEVTQALALDAVADQVYVEGEPIPDLVLPAAVGGTAPYTYSLSPAPPVGLVFEASSRTLSGTPTAEMARALYTYTVTDAADSTVSQTFNIEVYSALTLAQVADQVYVLGEEITPLVLPQAVGGRGSYAYALVPAPPAGLVFEASSRTLSGTPTAAMDTTRYTYTVTDAADSTASQEFSIAVLAALALPGIADQVYAVGEEVTPLVLPAAMGGQGPYAYAFSPDPPAGLAYDAQTRTLSGTPTAVMARAVYTYTVTDAAPSTATQTFSIAVGATAALIRDRAALIALYNATDGPNWTDHTNWLNPPADVATFTGQELNAWFGVTVLDDRVVALQLPRNSLRGTLPEELGDLTALLQLRLYGNSLEGTIPPELGQLDSLRGLLLHDNALIGAIPPDLGNLPSLEQLHLHNNGLDGGIPEALGALAVLKQLWLYGNSLGGTIPRDLGRLDSLRGLLLQDNALIGAIPPELGDLAHLEDLWLQGNSLEGTIPRELGQLDRLRGLLLHENQLTGAIPPELGGLAYLQDLWLHSNALEDSIPRALGTLDSLRGLVLHDNQLTGTIPSSLGDLSHLRWLQLQENALEGSIPPALGRLTQLERLQLSGNALAGSIPDSLGQLGALEYLYVDNNALSGVLPGTLVQLSALKELFFDGPDQDVCAPADAVFRAWLGSLEAGRGPDCGGTAALEFAAPVPDQRYLVGQGIADLDLPPVQGGSASFSYTLHPALPAGLVYDAQTRTLRGVPSDTVSNRVYTYTAVDESGTTGQLTFAITVTPRLAELLELHGNYPNPFRETTHLELSLARKAWVNVEVFDLLGRSVLRQEGRPVEAGPRRRLAIDGMDMEVPGVYLYRIVAVTDRQTLVRTGRMIRMR